MQEKLENKKVVSLSKFSKLLAIAKGQLNSEWIHEVIVSPKIPTKNYRDFCAGSLLKGRAKISVIFG
jgi:hypothetical protein